ncbi:MAG: EamA family transporter [Candidatus Woesearchaeota archaeon]
MSWILYTLVGVIFFSIVNVLDKIILSKYIKNNLTLVVYKSLVWYSVVLLLPFVGFSMPDPVMLAFIVLAGVIGLIAFVPYVKALAAEEASRIVPLLQLQSVFVLLLSFVFMRESLGLLQMIGFSAILVGSFIISVKDFRKLFSVNIAVWLIAFATFLWAINIVVFSYCLKNGDFWSVLILGLVVSSTTSLGLLGVKEIKQDFMRNLRDKKSRRILICDGFVHLAGIFGLNLGLLYGSPTLVSVVGGLQGFFVFVLTVLLSRFFPKILKENIDRRVLLTKFVAIAFMFAGLVLLNP